MTETMMMISCSKLFWSREEASSTVKMAVIESKGDFFSGEEIPADWTGKKIIILVHGFNCSVQSTIEIYFKFKQMLESYCFHYDYIIGFVWPCHIGRMHYRRAKAIVPKASQMLATFIKTSGLANARQIDLLGHSMGARLALETVKRVSLHTLFLLGPAIDADHFEKNKSALDNCQKAVITYSSRDWLLKWCYPIIEMAAQSPMGSFGPSYKEKVPKNAYFIESSLLIRHHNAYTEERLIFLALFKALQAENQFLFANSSGAAEMEKIQGSSLWGRVKAFNGLLFNQVLNLIFRAWRTH